MACPHNDMPHGMIGITFRYRQGVKSEHLLVIIRYTGPERGMSIYFQNDVFYLIKINQRIISCPEWSITFYHWGKLLQKQPLPWQPDTKKTNTSQFVGHTLVIMEEDGPKCVVPLVSMLVVITSVKGLIVESNVAAYNYMIFQFQSASLQFHHHSQKMVPEEIN